METLKTYETAAAVAAALPEPEREMFASLLDDLTRPTFGWSECQQLRHLTAVRRWLRDAGWVKR